ncbi:predicted protein [Micromonas commoda]|uniref:Uncharacterized protein n=1 Tax=Micromonas commoda (strain RCC299 / NOUM17 / CCMP2709) TaxID=296587 RepID=C1EEJ8_MICCC|nr:predicted protein [Micromonas commoda]ACO66548.1 predicted protein [Micromonas commoda]|eukprot:XP_002505290.1 predicted protein [Micromonas commoda]
MSICRGSRLLLIGYQKQSLDVPRCPWDDQGFPSQHDLGRWTWWAWDWNESSWWTPVA